MGRFRKIVYSKVLLGIPLLLFLSSSNALAAKQWKIGIHITPGVSRLPLFGQSGDLYPRWNMQIAVGGDVHYPVNNRIHLVGSLHYEQQRFRYQAPDWADNTFKINLKNAGVSITLEYAFLDRDQNQVFSRGGLSLMRRLQVQDNWNSVYPKDVYYAEDTRYETSQLHIRPLIGVGYARQLNDHLIFRWILQGILGWSPVRTVPDLPRYLIQSLENKPWGGGILQIEILFNK